MELYLDNNMDVSVWVKRCCCSWEDKWHCLKGNGPILYIHIFPYSTLWHRKQSFQQTSKQLECCTYIPLLSFPPKGNICIYWQTNYSSVLKSIFSHSEGCLFALLIVSFVVQKLLSLIRSHLFIFAFISSILGGGS